MSDRFSTKEIKILHTVNASENGLSGVEISKATKITSGTLYPILLQFEQAGFFFSKIEDEPKPRRRIYTTTYAGQIVAARNLPSHDETSTGKKDSRGLLEMSGASKPPTALTL